MKQIIQKEIKNFKSVEGLNLLGEAFGSPENTPILLTHGIGQTRHSWRDTASILAERNFYTIALDARGHGESDWSRDGLYDIEKYIADLKIIITSFKQKPIIVGASMGGFTALLMEGEAKEILTKALILVDISPSPKKAGVQRIFDFMNAYVKTGFASMEEAAEAVSKFLPHRSKADSLKGLEHNLHQKEDGRFYWHWDPALISSFGQEKNNNLKNAERIIKAAQNLTVPTLVIRGEKSDLVTEQAIKIFEVASVNIKSVVVKGAHHMVAGDANNEFMGEVLNFIEQL